MRATPRRRSSADPAGPLADFATTITERRLALGLTQLDLADLADVGISSVRNLESGRTSPSLSTSLRILDALGLILVSMPLGDAQELPERAVALRTRQAASK